MKHLPIVEKIEFAEFFAALHDGQRPYPWQITVLEKLLADGCWPSSISAPTGSGKSAVVDIHVFAVAVANSGCGNKKAMPPRRLWHVVGRRALVDAVAQRAAAIQAKLLQALESGESEILFRVAKILNSLSLSDELLPVSILRGGVLPERGWQDDPIACQIVCSTPDMAGSRLLFRGYGSTPGMRPREAGLLAYDSVMVVDEAHLNQQLLLTARRVRELALESPLANSIPALQVVASSATLPQVDVDTSVGITSADVRTGVVGTALQHRLIRAKPVTIHNDGVWLPGSSKTVATKAIKKILQLVEDALDSGQTPVGVVLNRVDSALAVYGALIKQLEQGDLPLKVSLLVGPRRRWEDYSDRHQGKPEVYVATQTIEVGVDLDFGCLITDLAEGSALAQRAGRLNRQGHRESAPIHVLCPPKLGNLAAAAALPYSLDDLEATMEWLGQLGHMDMSPASVLETPPPPTRARKLEFSHLDSSRAELLSRTSETFAVEPDLTFWLRDSFDSDNEVTVIGRILPRVAEPDRDHVNDYDIDAAITLLEAVPPQPHEAFPTTVGKVRELVHGLPPEVPVFVWRAGSWEHRRSATAVPLFAGDIVCIPHDVVGSQDGVLVPKGPELIGDVLDPRDEELNKLPISDSPYIRSVVFVTGTNAYGVEDYWRKSLLEICADERDSGQLSLQTIHDALVDRGQERFLKKYLGLSDDLGVIPTGEVQVRCGNRAPGNLNQASWVVFDLVDVPDVNETLQSEVSKSGLVTLTQHQSDVAVRAKELGVRLGLPQRLTNILYIAGLHHDDGKIDQRFQSWLLQNSERVQEPVAKSALSTLAHRQTRFLPTGWRHEQLSVAMLWAENPDLDPLVYRLVGTSHGRGRAVFSMNASELLPKAAAPNVVRAAEQLFDEGRWDACIEATDRNWGIWAASWYEALLRAADVTVSKEGR